MVKNVQSAGPASGSAPGTQKAPAGALASLLPLDDADRLMQRLAQLSALLAMTYGDARETFLTLSDSAQDSYLWHCEELARECRELASESYSHLQIALKRGAA